MTLFLNLCRVVPIDVPANLANVRFAYRVSDDAFYPEVRVGDIVCCFGLIARTEAWPSLAVVEQENGQAVLSRKRPTLPILQALKIRLIIKG